MFLKLLLSVALPACALGTWTPTLNTYESMLEWRPNHFQPAITGLSSRHSNFFQDRTWSLAYKTFPGGSNQQVTGVWANTYGNNMLMDWSGQKRILTGVLSYHSNNVQDRQWKFRTAMLTGERHLVDCAWLGATTVDRYFSKQCPDNKYIAGVKSQFKIGSKDRVYDFKCCAVADITDQPTAQPTSSPTTPQPTDSPTLSSEQMSKLAHLDYTVGEDNGVVYKCSGEFEAVTCYQFDADKNSWTHMTSEPAATMGQGTVETDTGKFTVDDFGLTLVHQDGLQHYWPWECGCSA